MNSSSTLWEEERYFVDTAIRTAQSGYMQRRLVNALQDLQSFNPSGLMVLITREWLFDFLFGEDGVDPAKSDFGKAADLNKIIDENRLGDANPNYDSGVEQEGK